MFLRSAYCRSFALACFHLGVLGACTSSDDAGNDATTLGTTSADGTTPVASTGVNPGPASAAPTSPAAPLPNPEAPSSAVTSGPLDPIGTSIPSPTNPAPNPAVNPIPSTNPTPSAPVVSTGNGGSPGIPSAEPTDSEPSGGGTVNAGGASTEASGGTVASVGGNDSLGGNGTAGTPAGDGGSGNTGSSDAPFTRAETVRVMAFGDSTTATGDWRRRFWDKLQMAGYTNIDMVGSGNDGGGGFDGNNEGHSGVLVTNVTNDEINGWATTNPADVVLFHWATNDVWSNVSTNNILDAYTRMVDGLRAGNPNVIVLVAQIIPVAPPTCGDCPARTENLNDAIPAWAGMTSTMASPVVVVDQWTGFDPATGTEDGVHPYTATGAQHIADNWYDALLALYQD